MHSKTGIFNLALGALLLSRQITDADTDNSNEAKVLRLHYDIAFNATLEDLDLDSTSSQMDLELIQEEPNTLWLFAYKYPSDCASLRRIQSCVRKDNDETYIDKAVRMLDGQKCIFTNEENAIVEFISSTIEINSLSAMAGLCVAYRLASLAAALNVGKGAQRLQADIMQKYVMSKTEAQEKDKRENYQPNDPYTESEFVRERTS